MTGRKLMMVLMLVTVAACREGANNITGSYAEGASADGKSSSFAVASDGSKLKIDRSKRDANPSSGNKRRDKHEFEGVVRSAVADSIVVYTSRKEEVTIALTPDTVIRRGNQILTAADLVTDLRVHVRARKVADGYVAQEIVVQGSDDDEGDGDDLSALRQYEGTVVTASATALVINDSHRNEVTFAITADTVIRKGNTPVAAADLPVGQRVHVKAEVAADGSARAVEITVQGGKK